MKIFQVTCLINSDRLNNCDICYYYYYYYYYYYFGATTLRLALAAFSVS
jgi:hypothetical protein